jgi:hypothetical protein
MLLRRSIRRITASVETLFYKDVTCVITLVSHSTAAQAQIRAGCIRPEDQGKRRRRLTNFTLSCAPSETWIKCRTNTQFGTAFPEQFHDSISVHLLQHSRQRKLQEDVCFALWRPSCGRRRFTGVIYEALLPGDGDRVLAGNVSFTERYFRRALTAAVDQQQGVHRERPDSQRPSSLPQMWQSTGNVSGGRKSGGTASITWGNS